MTRADDEVGRDDGRPVVNRRRVVTTVVDRRRLHIDWRCRVNGWVVHRSVGDTDGYAGRDVGANREEHIAAGLCHRRGAYCRQRQGNSSGLDINGTAELHDCTPVRGQRLRPLLLLNAPAGITTTLRTVKAVARRNSSV